MITPDNADPAAYLRALWSKDQRRREAIIEAIKSEYIRGDRDDLLGSTIDMLVDNAARRRNANLPHGHDNRRYGIGMLLVAPSGAGKTTALREAFRNHPAFPNFGGAGWCPLISIGAPSPCTLRQLAMRILDQFDYDTERELRENAAWRRVHLQMREQNILFLHIDDLQHVLHQAGEEEMQKIRDTLKDLMTSADWPVHIILSGMPDLVPFVAHDRQLRRRLRYIAFADLSVAHDGEVINDAVKKLVETSGLKLDLDADVDLIGRLFHAASYQFGLSIEIVGDAIENALLRNEGTLTLEDFAVVYGSRTLQPATQNPFVANLWSTVDTSLLRSKTEEQKPESAPAKAGGKLGRDKRPS
ncbi:hypothetical protein RPB_2537 [Rhodopseudomonas palustris HaA2]|uniref:AAA+ ATPase domain-containing protein n=1 Tax=Rhodopseudomonas palustris (strain HaA2) TaxID=316058 RepID=Q2IX19_RHOP2|nr:ATP-binding protein [Rhodopseudomonas palustris]ABD07241.1 hypothetical protein RPB_2537 [Rhodopseudomonas palustris HaA2]